MGGGHDLVNSSVSFTLADNVKDLTLTGAAALSGTGNALANLVTGNSGKNTLNGAAGDDQLVGGLGNDSLYGGLGADTFIYKLGDGNDQLLDFSGPRGRYGRAAQRDRGDTGQQHRDIERRLTPHRRHRLPVDDVGFPFDLTSVDVDRTALGCALDMRKNAEQGQAPVSRR